MACDSQDYGLRDAKALEKGPDLVTRLIAIHDRHVAVHQNQSVRSIFIEVGLNVLNNLLVSLEPIHSNFTNHLRVL